MEPNQNQRWIALRIVAYCLCIVLSVSLLTSCGTLKYPEALYGHNVIGGDGHLVALDNGPVVDTNTGLMWAAKDNGKDINWRDGKAYCENYRGGGYTDWRMPTKDELEEIHGWRKKNRYGCHVSKLIELTTCSVWGSDTRGPWAVTIHFTTTSNVFGVTWHDPSNSTDIRALPVRVGK